MKGRASDGTLYVATHGNGVYKAVIPDMEYVKPEQNENKLSFGPVYPNPFSGQVYIPFVIPEDGRVRINIYTVSGQLLRTLLQGTQFAGKNIAIWDGLNSSGYPVNTGVYICQLEYQNKRLSTKVILYR